MQERWKQIPGYPNYEISSHGRVKSLARMVLRSNAAKAYLIRDRILSAGLSHNGENMGYRYYTVSLRNELGKKTHRVHRLVGEAFVEGFSPDLDILHVDDNACNNHWTNLRWGTHQDNMDDKVAKDRQTKGEDNHSILTEKDVLEIVRKKRAGATLRGLGAEYGVSYSTINLIMLGENWSHVTGIPKRKPQPRKRKVK
jgi:hypothetical protein